MTNGEITSRFFLTVGKKTSELILANIANHYGIDQAAARDEVTGEGAESLLDYVTGGERAATALLMRGHSAKGSFA